MPPHNVKHYGKVHEDSDYTIITTDTCAYLCSGRNMNSFVLLLAAVAYSNYIICASITVVTAR